MKMTLGPFLFFPFQMPQHLHEFVKKRKQKLDQIDSICVNDS